jgi:hypothetical protein
MDNIICAFSCSRSTGAYPRCTSVQSGRHDHEYETTDIDVNRKSQDTHGCHWPNKQASNKCAGRRHCCVKETRTIRDRTIDVSSEIGVVQSSIALQLASALTHLARAVHEIRLRSERSHHDSLSLCVQTICGITHADRSVSPLDPPPQAQHASTAVIPPFLY